MTETLSGVEQMELFAKRFFATLAPSKDHATVIGLSGDLGSGKTTFVKYLAREFGIKEEIVSPTFVLAKYYDISNESWKKFVHIDAYRIDDADEMKVLKWEYMLAGKDQIIFVEWPEKIAEIFPKFATMLKFEFVDKDTRNISVL